MTSGPSTARQRPLAPSVKSVLATNAIERWSLAFCGGLTISLFLARFYYVAESADRGETLGLVGLWLLALAVWVMTWWRAGKPLTTLGWGDLAVALLAGGHIVSAIRIIATQGDKRSAVNLAWEWAGVWICWFLIRQQASEPGFRRLIAAGLIATGTAVAGLGLYQHYVEFPGIAAKYGPMFDRLKQADPVEAASLRKQLAKENIPVDGPGAILFEKRLRDSREPLGFFALANNLGGFLAVCLIVLIAGLKAFRPSKGQMVACFGFLAVLGWCLLLTKSRTGWIGTVVGVSTLALGWRGTRATGIRYRHYAVFAVLLICISWGLSRLGGLDSQVLTEAPKSLQYRLQYWVATSRMIRDHLIFGVGPGQFRSHYLYYKLPEASEEISDPHNLFFDVTANGGLVSLSGLVILCLLLFQWWRPDPGVQSSEIASTGLDEIRAISVIFAAASIAWIWLLVTGSDDRLLIVLPVSAGLFWFIRGLIAAFPEQESMFSIAFSSAALGLAMHLCGAGGIGMPAISTLLLTLIACSIGSSDQTNREIKRLSMAAVSLIAVSTGLMVGLWYVTGMRPVSLVQECLLAGDRHAEAGRLDLADSQYASAAQGDSFTSEPWRRRAELAYRKAGADQYRSNESFQGAVDLMLQAKLRDPDGFQDDFQLGQWWRSRWRRMSKPEDLQEAVNAFSRAASRYPTNAILHAEFALTLADSGDIDSARKIAQQALAQDQINHQWGHVDRFLAESIRLRLEALLKDENASANGANK